MVAGAPGGYTHLLWRAVVGVEDGLVRRVVGAGAQVGARAQVNQLHIVGGRESDGAGSSAPVATAVHGDQKEAGAGGGTRTLNRLACSAKMMLSGLTSRCTSPAAWNACAVTAARTKHGQH